MDKIYICAGEFIIPIFLILHFIQLLQSIPPLLFLNTKNNLIKHNIEWTGGCTYLCMSVNSCTEKIMQKYSVTTWDHHVLSIPFINWRLPGPTF